MKRVHVDVVMANELIPLAEVRRVVRALQKVAAGLAPIHGHAERGGSRRALRDVPRSKWKKSEA